MNKKIIAIVIILAVIVAGIVMFIAKNGNAPAKKSVPNEAPEQAPENPTLNTSPTRPSAPTSASLPASVSVTIQNFKFSPKTVIVKKGATVAWTNNDSAPHTVTADKGELPQSGSINPGGTYNAAFNTTGTFDYHCGFHPSMRATVIVQ